MQKKIYQLLYIFSVEYLSGLTSKLQKINHVAPSVELMMQMWAIWN